MNDELTNEQKIIELKAKIFDLLREAEALITKVKKIDEIKTQLVEQLKQLENN